MQVSIFCLIKKTRVVLTLQHEILASRSTKAKLDCLFKLLRDTCHPDATLLIINYFKETLPSGCTYSPGYPVIQPRPLKFTTPPKFPSPHSRPRSHQEVMSDFPHSRFVNDGSYDERDARRTTSSGLPLRGILSKLLTVGTIVVSLHLPHLAL